jgi:low affinity Fe/Cu permease
MHRAAKKRSYKPPIVPSVPSAPVCQESVPSANKLFARLAKVTSKEAGRAWVFVIALGTIVAWAISGPFFNYSDTWQLVINTGTTIVTFLMVFLIQNSQNRDSAAIQVKLDELIRVSKAHNSFMGLERLTDDELEEIRAKCTAGAAAELAARGRPSELKKEKLPGAA